MKPRFTGRRVWDRPSWRKTFKAGSYAIQDLGAMYVEAVEGNYTNVVGLPLPTLYRLTAELGHDLRRWMGSRDSEPRPS